MGERDGEAGSRAGANGGEGSCHEPDQGTPSGAQGAAMRLPQWLVLLASLVPPGTPSGAQGAAMRLPQWLVLLASLVPPALGSWGVAYPEVLQGVRDSCIVVPCTLSYPANVATGDGIVAIWYKDYDNQKTLVYHSAAQEVDARFRGRAQLLGDPAARNCTLLLRGVTPEDSGPYRFRFEIVNGDRWSAARDVMLSISDDLARPSTAASEEQTEGQTSTLECSTPYACPPGDIALRWEGYDPQVSVVSSHVQLDTSGVGHHLTLTTSFSWKDHSKKLLCEVSYGSRKATGEVALRADAPKDTQVSVSRSAQNIRVGDTVSLTCEVTSSYPPVSTYHWYKDGTAIGSERILTFRGVRREDYGQYHCEAKNAIGAGVAPTVTLYVFCKCQGSSLAAGVAPRGGGGIAGGGAGPQEREGVYPASPGWGGQGLAPRWPAILNMLPSPSAAEILVSPAAEVQEGTATTLSCDVPGREGQDLNYTWYKNSAWLKEGTVHTLLFHHVAASDTGYYSCKVTNDQGSDTSQAISLSVTYPPRTPTITLFQESQGGRLVIVHCAVDSPPPATAAPASTEVLIRPSVEVREGTAVTLTCLGAWGAAEETLYTWYRNSKRLQESSAPTLHFPSVHGEDAGAFQCRVQSSDGSDTSAAVPLRVLFPPRQPVMSSFLETQGGHLGIIQCTTESDPEANLTLWRGQEVIACTWGCPAAPNPRVHATLSYNSLKVEIREVVLEDEGTYVCWAGNPQGNASAAVDFRAETASIAVAPSSHVLEGHAANLTCRLSSDSPALPNFTWYQNGQWLAEGSAASLVFRQVASTDAGLYHCRATTDGSSRSSPAISLDVLYPPRDPQLTAFLETGRGRLAIFQCLVASNPPARLALHRDPPRVPVLTTFLEAPKEQQGVLQCTVDSSPQAELALFKDQALVASTALPQPTTPPRLSVTLAFNMLRVSIHPVLLEDEGEYVCSASNAYGNASTAVNFTAGTARVWISPSPDVREGAGGNLTHPPRNLQMKAFVESGEGTAVILFCAVESNPLSEITLLKGGQPVASSPPAGGDHPGQSGHISPAPNALRLELRDASEEDEGEYECQARSPLGSARASLPLRVQAVRVVVRPSAEVPEGTDLPCRDTGARPGTVYTWYKNGRWLAEGLDASLVLPGARRTDAGAYACLAGRGLRGRRAPPPALPRPYAPQEPSFISLVEPRGGRQAVLLCTVDSFPPSDIVLHRGPGHAPLASTQGPADPRFTVQGAPNSLRVGMGDLEPRDAGLYVCSANNSYGTASSSLRLDVGGVTVTVEPSPEVPEGTTATMNCSAIPWVGEEANYTWYKNSRWLREGPASSLVLAPVSSIDTGSYRCRASGTRGSAASAPLSLNVLYPPRDVSVSTFLENRSGRVGIVLCTADSHPASTIALLAPGPTSHNSLRVELGAVGPEDSGEYTCVVGNRLGNATASAYFDMRTLTHLLAFTILAGLLTAVICVAALALLAVKLWPR
ncbi:PREDICTED: sialoadhesin [Aptenodytes forsteri]|uniref:sialoadhesin n=1 Tax=Aptenodytes forsteri TaxID=9233 RepID=UPI000904FC18|nr:PREDICTED: sialoadhesin [Aptenodytes forsteri]